MAVSSHPIARVAIACGGTGGHLFPGLAVAQQLVRRDCAVTLLISPKEVDQQAVRQALVQFDGVRPSPGAAGQGVVGAFHQAGAWGRADVAVSEDGLNPADLDHARHVEVATLPAVGLQRGGKIAFLRGMARSCRVAGQLFQTHPPQAVLGMGGFTSAPPILAGKRYGARTFLHESNSIPGRANRWLSWIADCVFVAFPSATQRLRKHRVSLSGTPVREQFRLQDVAACRAELGLDPARPMVLVMGGSQGASGINDVVVKALPLLVESRAQWQWLHLSGSKDELAVRAAYDRLNLRAVVHPFFNRMELALGAADAAISRAGASALAELAAMRLPALLVPYPAAVDNHQYYNAEAFAASGAARLEEQAALTPRRLADHLFELVGNSTAREQIKNALARWHAPRAAEQIAEAIGEAISLQETVPKRRLNGIPLYE